MSTITAAPTRATAVRRSDPVTGALLALGGVAFLAGGAMHPGDSGEGTKVAQLHEMLVAGMWYPSHALLLAAMACIAGAILRLRWRDDLDGQLASVIRVVSVIAVIATVGMMLHLLSALGAEAIADGSKTFAYHLQELNETVVDASWALGIAALAVAGGRTRALGNPVTLALGLVGGLAFALASATIAYTDRFDGLFPVASLIGIWAVVVGLMVLVGKRPSEPGGAGTTT